MRRCADSCWVVGILLNSCAETALRSCARRSPSSATKNGSSERGARCSAIHHQLDRVDVRGILRGKEEHGFGEFFRLTPTAQRVSARETRCHNELKGSQ